MMDPQDGAAISQWKDHLEDEEQRRISSECWDPITWNRYCIIKENTTHPKSKSKKWVKCAACFLGCSRCTKGWIEVQKENKMGLEQLLLIALGKAILGGELGTLGSTKACRAYLNKPDVLDDNLVAVGSIEIKFRSGAAAAEWLDDEEGLSFVLRLSGLPEALVNGSVDAGVAEGVIGAVVPKIVGELPPADTTKIYAALKKAVEGLDVVMDPC